MTLAMTLVLRFGLDPAAGAGIRNVSSYYRPARAISGALPSARRRIVDARPSTEARTPWSCVYSGPSTKARIPCSHPAATLDNTAARELLHPALLLLERNTVHARRVHVRCESLRPVLREIPGHRAIRQPQAGAIRRHRQHASHQTGLLDLAGVQCLGLVRSAEFTRRDPARCAGHAGIAINIVDVYVVDDGRAIDEDVILVSAIEPAPPPGTEGFKRRQRHPSERAESE